MKFGRASARRKPPCAAQLLPYLRGKKNLCDRVAICGLGERMIQPDFKTFCRLARQGNLVPVHETYTADLLTPVGAYFRIARDAKYSFLLESVEGGETIGRYTFAGADPVEVFRARGRICTLERGGKRVDFEGDPVEQLRRLTTRYHPVRLPGLP